MGIMPKIEKSILGLLPLMLFLALFLALPIGTIFNFSFRNNENHLTLQLYRNLFTGEYARAFEGSYKLAGASMLISGVLGAMMSWAIARSKSNIRVFFRTIAVVFSNTGGVPLAFMFLAAFGQEGLIVRGVIKLFHYDIYSSSFELFNFWGLILVYCFFQIPLMVIVFLPALENVRSEWREANSTLGGSFFSYFKNILVPILAPTFLASLLLLFGNAFSAFSTANAMTNGTLSLVPIMIGNLMNGEVVSGETNQAAALACGMIFSILLTVALSLSLMRKFVRL